MDNASLKPQSGAVALSMLISRAVFLLMMIIGLLMRASQGEIIAIEPTFFYQLLTVHGAGMVGTAGLSGAAIMWYFVGRHVQLSSSAYWIFLSLFLLGVVFILVAVLIGGFGGAWTFLYPLPAMSGGAWEPWAAALFVLGYTSIGVAFLIYYLAVGYPIIRQYGGLGRALGWHVAFGGADASEASPPTIVAAATVTIFNTLGIVVGAAVLVITLVNLLVPGFTIDALLAKNMIFFFGHVFINAAIYMAVIAVYEIIPEYTGRPWKSSRAFIIAWTCVLLFVMAVYPHHLLQDMVMPAWMLVMGQIVSYLSGIPLLTVTAFGLCVYLRGSKLKWNLASSLLVVAVAGWSIGTIPAVIDGMIAVNKVMHNTQWVPGHFHIYLLLCEVAMSFGFMAWLVRKGEVSESRISGIEKLAFTAYVAGAAGFAVIFLISGAMSIPRRWAVHLPEWVLQAQIGTAFATLAVLGALIFVVRFASGIRRAK